MSLKELKKYTFISRYPRYLADKKRRETWNETITRVKEMHLRKYPQVASEIEWAFQFVYDKKVLPSQRSLQFGGVGVEKNNVRSYNCGSRYLNEVRAFQECLYVLLSGCGVGISILKEYIDKLPSFKPRNNLKTKKFIIPDSIEGWSDAVGELVSSYLVDACVVEFDYSLIRPKGSRLSSSAGKAPGPEPLANALENIRKLLDRCINNNQIKLRPIDAHDIVMHASDAVLSGGVRRSACVSIFSPDDEEMVKCKTGDWFYTNPQRARANNSVLLLRDQTSYEEFQKIMQNIKEYGEPGFIFAGSNSENRNACLETGFYCYNDKGESGWQFCNLTTINGKKVKTLADFLDAAKAASIIGTLQAGYTKFDYLGRVSEEITEKEALLGVSITGIMERPDIILNSENQQLAAKTVVEVNQNFCKKIGVNPAARCTLVKPEGTSSAILGVSSGIHPHHAKKYIRRVQSNKTEAPANLFQSINPEAVEESKWSANKTDIVLSFCVEVEPGAKVKNDLSALELLNIVKQTQINWVNPGQTEYSIDKSIRHGISNTIHVRPEEWDDVCKFLYENRDTLPCVSLLPVTGDKDYVQAPFTAVYTPSQMLKEYGDGFCFASGLITEGIELFNDDLWKACDAVLSKYDITGDDKELSKSNWVKKVYKFADRYLGGDLLKTTYLFKDVYNWKKWLDLNRTYKEVDYTQVVEEEDNTSFEQEPACAGGACEII